ncbi:MAG: thermonuclease family protein [Planctomycetota bacterium]
MPHVQHPDSRPPSGVVRACRVVGVYDGDTLTVELITRARIRMVGCWAPEVRTKDKDEKKRGLAARDYLRELALDKEGEVFIPLRGVDRLDDVLSMGRVTAVVYIGDSEKSLSELMVEAGHASTQKDGEPGT